MWMPYAIRPLGNLAYAVHRQGRFDEAAELYDRALALRRLVVGLPRLV